MPFSQADVQRMRETMLCGCCGKPVGAFVLMENYIDGGGATVAAACHGATESRHATASELAALVRYGGLFFAPPDED